MYNWPKDSNRDDPRATVTVHELGSLTINSGSFQLLRVPDAVYDSSIAGMVPVNKAPFEIAGSIYVKGGDFKDNKGDPGAAGVISLRGSEAYMEMTGGSIHDNVATARADQYGQMPGSTGGAVSVRDGAKFLMTGGEIKNNIAYGIGGGVFVSGQESEFVLDGGSISGNSALIAKAHEEGSGGGIAVLGGGNLELKSGQIVNNHSDFHGGGIYISQYSSMNTAKIIVADNIAKQSSGVTKSNPQGGGIWHCEYGKAIVKSGESLALFDNKAIDVDATRPGAGDDLSILQQDPGEAPYEVSNLNWMLGGGKVQYFLDGHAKQPYGTTTTVIPRYDKAQVKEEIKEIPNEVRKRSISVVSITDEASKTYARKNAVVWVSGNTATLGGGIANNGDMTFEAPQVEVLVDVIWDHGDNPVENHPKITKVGLLKQGAASGESLPLNGANGWNGVFSNLRMYFEGEVAVYGVQEEQFKDYKVVVTQVGENRFLIKYVFRKEKTPTSSTTESTTTESTTEESVETTKESTSESTTEANTKSSAETSKESTQETTTESKGLSLKNLNEAMLEITVEPTFRVIKSIPTNKIVEFRPHTGKEHHSVKNSKWPLLPRTGESSRKPYIVASILLLGIIASRIKRSLEKMD